MYATQSAVGAIYGVEVNANGHVAGYKSIGYRYSKCVPDLC